VLVPSSNYLYFCVVRGSSATMLAGSLEGHGLFSSVIHPSLEADVYPGVRSWRLCRREFVAKMSCSDGAWHLPVTAVRVAVRTVGEAHLP